jgi:glutamate-1-semialdehyde 2,1-aminomutase
MAETAPRYVSRTPTSKNLFARAREVLPGGVSYGIRDLGPYPFYVARATGSRLYDVDGNEYTDYWCGHGAMILGHAPQAVVDAACRQISLGSHFGFAHPLEVQLAEMVTHLVPGAEMVRFTNSGTEANMYAVALARGFTGRTRVAKMEGGWHGGLECLNKGVHPPFDIVESAGFNAQAQAETIVLPFNDLDAASKALAREDLASLHIEPVMGGAGCIPADREYLVGLRELTTRHGTLLVFDEVISGFRLAPGGAQQIYGVTPDITILGKTLGGGFPVGALCGRRDVFARLDHRRTAAKDRVFQGGTFSANPVSMAAGLETLTILATGPAYAELDHLGARMRSGLERVFGDAGVDAGISGVGSMVGIHFRRGGAPRNAREAAEDDAALGSAYFDHMLERGIAYLSPPLPHMFLTTAHTEGDIDAFLEATEEFAGLRPWTPRVSAPQRGCRAGDPA